MAKAKERVRSSTSFVHHQIKKSEYSGVSNALWLRSAPTKVCGIPRKYPICHARPIEEG